MELDKRTTIERREKKRERMKHFWKKREMEEFEI